jgi:adenylate cyclase
MMGAMASEQLSIEDVAERAGVDVGYVRAIDELGVLGRGKHGYAERDVHLVALLRLWEEAGLSRAAILKAVEADELSLDFLESPGWELPAPLDRTYRQEADERGLPLELLLAIHESIGFVPPDPDERVRADDAAMAELARVVLDIGGSEDSVRRLFRVYADNLRRLVVAEADLYTEQVEDPSRRAGTSEPELMRRGAEVGRRIDALVTATLIAIYERHRAHVWAQHSIERAEVVLERAGLYQPAKRTPAICVVDLTGYTRLTEEQGDEAAARLATALADLVDGISRRHGGRPIRWLGDGGLFYFDETAAAVLAALEMSEEAPAAGLPPTHSGVQAGPVVFRDGDVYGRTVNIAARLADHAQAGEVLTSREVMEQVDLPSIRFDLVGPVELHGVAAPLQVARAVRDGGPTA